MKRIILACLCLMLLGCNTKTDIVKFKEEYEKENQNTGISLEIDLEANLKYVDNKQANELLEGTGILYLGFPTCPWCRNMVPILLEVAKENNLTVSYLNTRKVKKGEEYTKLLSLINDYLEEDENGKKVLYVPDVYFVKDGVIVGHNLGTVASQENPKTPLTEEQKNELKTIYQTLMDKIK